MPDTQHSKDEEGKSKNSTVHVKASIRHTKSGDVVNVRSHDKHLDAMGETLKDQNHTVPLASIPGKFPLGRSTPSTPAIRKAETARQDAELLAAQKEVEQLKEQLASISTLSNKSNSPTQPTYSPKYGYGDGVGQFGESGGYTSLGVTQ